MNFSYDSVKSKSKAQNEDFCFDVETPQGHFFAVLDFAPHDYANLNATLKGKLETVVGSFASLSGFAADLFLGFLAKEVNNFLHHLGEQSGGPEMRSSAALSLLSGKRLSYLLFGDVRLEIVSNGQLLPLDDAKPKAVEASSDDSGTVDTAEDVHQEVDQLGARSLEVPITDRVQALTLQENDVVLIMTHGVHAGLDRERLPDELASLSSPEPNLICEALMKASSSSRDDRTVVVIGGPYVLAAEPVSSDLSSVIAALEARVNTLVENDERREAAARVLGGEGENNDQQEPKVALQIEALKDHLKRKVSKIDLLELVDEKLKKFSVILASKADAAEVTGLQQDILKLGMVPDPSASSTNQRESAQETVASSGRSYLGKVVLLLLATAIAGAFVGAWLQSLVFRKSPEVWSVKTAANQIVISRLDGNSPGGQTVSLNVSEPLKSTGEQTFSSFADVKQYIDTVANPAPAPASPQNQASEANQSRESTPAAGATETTVKQGDTLQRLAERYNVAQEKLKELNPTITRWPAIRIGQKINVPSSTSANPTASPAVDQAAAQPAATGSMATLEVTLGPGDSLNRIVRRYKSTPERLKELNPQITNWASIRAGQKLLVPAPPGG